MNEIIFLWGLGLIWVIFASIQDLKQREVSNWLNFSLVIFALGFRFFYSLFSQNFNVMYQGLIGLGIFFVVGNLLYYGRLFAGGDAKLMIALGAVLPMSQGIMINLKMFLLFFFLFLVSGGFYGLIISGALSLKHFKAFKKEFFERLGKNKKMIYIAVFLGILLMLLGISNFIFFISGILVALMPFFYTYAKSVDEVCMVKKVKSTEIEEGDWLYRNIRVKGKTIEPNWEGLNKKEMQLIKKRHKTIMIRQGIPFVPVFLISFSILIFIFYFGFFDMLWNPFWQP